jgi:uroporphyrinogen decarboxylase
MNSREKFLNTMLMDTGSENRINIPKVEFGFWVGTLRRWASQGLDLPLSIPDTISDVDVIHANKVINKNNNIEKSIDLSSFFNLDDYLTKFPTDYSPMFDKKIINKDDEYIFYKDEYGVLNKNDLNVSSPPLEIDHPVKDWNSWNEYKQYYLSGSIKKRLPLNWGELVLSLKDRDFPIRLGGLPAGFLGFPRQIMGLTNYMIMLHDDPKLIHDICDTFLNFIIEYYGVICTDVKVDCLLIWEDMAGKTGSMISPAHFREFLSPRYKSIVNFACEMGIDIVLTDSDGFVEDIIPLIIETGVTGMYPFERAAGNDLLKIRENFPAFQILGGFDKRVLFKDSNYKRIDEELGITKKLLEKGRFIPHVDHHVSQDCTLENFLYYRERLNEIIDSN